MKPAASTSGLPENFDGFRLVRVLGRGAAGEVYLGHDTLLDRAVAIKLITTAELDEAARARVLTEARAVARLRHPNVVGIYRLGEVGGRPYLVTELVRGTSLDKLRVPLSADALVALALGVARGLAAAHRQGVLHRDLKPANVVLGEAAGEIKIVDFGLAQLTEQPVNETSGNVFIGTPAYMAPELFRGGAASVRSDIWGVGGLLHYAATGRPPHDAESIPELIDAVSSRDVPPPEGVEPRMRDIIERCLRRDPGARWSSAEDLREAIEELAAGAPSPRRRAAGQNPYRGLRVFEAEHRALFFGRDDEIAAVLERLRTGPFVLVAADSGIGKSSLCRAGVVPAVVDGQLGDRRSWSQITLVPGARPLTTLIAGLARALDVDEKQLTREVAADLNGIGRALAARQGEQRGVILFIDQAEELVTLSEPGEARAVAEVIDRLAGASPSVRILSTVRTDFLTRLSALLGIGETLNRALYVLGPLSAPGIRDAIVGPARVAGVRFESPEMVETLVESTVTADGALPLLQFALAELWQIRDEARQVIPMAALDAIGGVAGALSRHGDRVLAELTAPQRAAARRVLGQLVTAEGLRSRRSDAELGTDRPDVRAVVDALVGARLVITREAAEGQQAAYEVAHEALIHGWGSLRAWLEADADLRAARERVAAAAAEWERLGRGREGLWRERQVGETRDLADLAPREADFLAASRRAARRGRVARIALAAGIPFLLLAGWGALRWRNARDLAERVDGELRAARSAAAVAGLGARELGALTAAAHAGFDHGSLDEAEQLWAQSRVLAGALDQVHAGALRRLDSALLLDARRADVRGAIADTLLERALLAEGTPLAGEYLERMALFDAGGERRRRWEAPGELTVDTRPPGTPVELTRVIRDPSGLRRLAPARPGPVAPGAYLVTAGAARLPVVVGRGETLHVTLDAAAAESAPPGFVYIPAGRFIFGTRDEALRREFFSTVPEHTVETGAYFISRNETTYQEYLDYLESLSLDERRARTPRIETGFHGALTLEEVAPGRWQLTMQPNDVAYRALAGQALEYQARDRRTRQDWLRFPVAGVTADDARAYAAWVDRTDRIPGARLCTEHEWERAARGADDRLYPHGDRLAPDDANFDETYGKRPAAFGPDEIGSHPASNSPFGVADLAGNVWEWTTSSIGPTGVAARGGSYFFARLVATSVNRQLPAPDFRDLTLGIRLCANVRP